ncbi:hypothetical protein [Roseomonas sp. WA12]
MIAPTTRRTAAAAALALLLATGALAPGFLPVGAALAQPAPDGDADDPAAPDAPAENAPGAADLSAAPRPALPLDVANLPLPADMVRLPIGGWRLGGRTGRGEPDHNARLAIETIGRYLANQTTGRVTILAQASGPAEDPSVARRTSLARAVTIKASLVRGGLASTRIDIRPLGRTAEAQDAIDIIAPAAPRRREAPATQPSPAPAPAAASAATPAPSPAPASSRAPNSAPSPSPTRPRGG